VALCDYTHDKELQLGPPEEVAEFGESEMDRPNCCWFFENCTCLSGAGVAAGWERLMAAVGTGQIE